MLLSRLLRPNFKTLTLIPKCSLSTLNPNPDPPNPSLSSRMSFVFSQIDAISQSQPEKHDALERIRAWRHSNPPQTPPSDSVLEETGRREVGVEVVHPWPEWIELMERLVQQNYFDLRRVDEERRGESIGVELEGFGGVAEDEENEFWRDWAAVCTAVKNFGHDRFDILRSLSRKDIQVLVGHGCPSTDGKVAYSGKLLRKLAHVNEGDVCSACSLRSSCKKAFLLVPKEDEARTLDVMRVLLTFGFDSINGSVKNKPLMKMKSVKTVVRKLLHEIVKLSAVPIDPSLPRPVIRKPPLKVKQAPPPPKKRVGRDDVEMKKGDWLCPQCDFMNFAKNAVCLQCDANRPKRQLLPGEWECPECNFLNYRRNMACFHCECKRPEDDFTANLEKTKQRDPKSGILRNSRLMNVSDAWNFDFDENASDGADVAAFEFADPPRGGEGGFQGFSSSRETDQKFDNLDDDEQTTRKESRYSTQINENNPNLHSHRTGFDDFDDEEDDVNNYEIDMGDKGRTPAVSRKNFSELENGAESEEFSDFDNFKHNHVPRGEVSDGGFQDSDSEAEADLPDQPRWKSRQQKGLSYGSDNEVHQNYNTEMRRGHKKISDEGRSPGQNRNLDRMASNRTSFRKNEGRLSRGGSHGMDDDFADHFENNRRGDSRGARRSRGSGFERHGRQDDRERNTEDFGSRRSNNRVGDSRGSGRPLRGQRSEGRQLRSNGFEDGSGRPAGRPRRVIER